MCHGSHGKQGFLTQFCKVRNWGLPWPGRSGLGWGLSYDCGWAGGSRGLTHTEVSRGPLLTTWVSHAKADGLARREGLRERSWGFSKAGNPSRQSPGSAMTTAWQETATCHRAEAAGATPGAPRRGRKGRNRSKPPDPEGSLRNTRFLSAPHAGRRPPKPQSFPGAQEGVPPPKACESECTGGSALAVGSPLGVSREAGSLQGWPWAAGVGCGGPVGRSTGPFPGSINESCSDSGGGRESSD